MKVIIEGKRSKVVNFNFIFCSNVKAGECLFGCWENEEKESCMFVILCIWERERERERERGHASEASG